MDQDEKIDAYFDNLEQWQTEIRQFRALALSCGLMEELKWGVPCYTHQGKNILILGTFKQYCTMSFFKGALLQDSERLLSLPGPNSQSVRMMKITESGDIGHLTATLKAYIFEAIALEEAGEKVDLRNNNDITWVEELQHKIDTMPAFKLAFEALTPGRQRAYNMFFEAAKQSKTRGQRIEKFTPRIMKGFGMNDCVCGLSKRMPSCDGSHREG
ncbi:MAG: hypothetical protein GC193_10460 [Cryomorphaceae bacterium]|nr:hypothetical protein [Cryomorphaceae bacterium]